MTALDPLNAWGVDVIISIQESFSEYEDFFDSATQLFDPLYAYTILFPLIVGINIKLATDIIVVSAVSEWLNMILKWLLREDRPYWWIRETSFYGTNSKLASLRPTVHQTPLTCETGPGSPSGHMMGAAAVGYVLAQAINQYISSREEIIGPRARKVLTLMTWMLYGKIMILVAVSRMFVATHFPHQCVLGLLVGLATAWAVLRWTSWRRSSRPLLLLVALCATSFTVACYWLQKLLHIDPQWSVKLAFKWCASPDTIHVNTTPLFCLVRDCAIFFGLALAAPLNRPNSLVPAVPALFSCVCLGWAWDLASAAVPTKDVLVFYSCHFMLQAAQPFIYIVALPSLARLRKTKKS